MLLSCLKHCLSSCLFKARLLTTWSTLIGQITHAWHCSCAKSILTVRQKCCKCVSVTEWCYKVRLLTRRFRSSVFCGKQELLFLYTDFFLFLFFLLSWSFKRNGSPLKCYSEKLLSLRNIVEYKYIKKAWGWKKRTSCLKSYPVSQ